MSEDQGLHKLEKLKLRLSHHENERIVIFSDGIFAITITLLILEVKVPEIADHLVATELPKELLHLIPKIVGHVVSFLVLGIYWTAHHYLFTYIKRHDHVLLWLNTTFMLCVALIPFPTGLISQYPEQQIAVVIYASTLVVIGIMLDLLWWYASTHHLIEDETDAAFIALVHRHIRIAPLLYFVSIAFSFFSLTISKIIFVIVGAFYIFPNRGIQQHYKELARRVHRKITH